MKYVLIYGFFRAIWITDSIKKDNRKQHWWISDNIFLIYNCSIHFEKGGYTIFVVGFVTDSSELVNSSAYCEVMKILINT